MFKGSRDVRDRSRLPYRGNVFTKIRIEQKKLNSFKLHIDWRTFHVNFYEVFYLPTIKLHSL